MGDPKEYFHNKGEKDASNGTNDSPHGIDDKIIDLVTFNIFNSRHVGIPNTKEEDNEDKDAYRKGQENTNDQIEDNNKKGSSCFLTTACVNVMGLPDSCPELMTLRNFRDTYMQCNERYKHVINEYSKIAPRIVDAVNNRKDAEEIWKSVYVDIKQAILLINTNQQETAVEYYQSMVIRLKTLVGL